MKPQSFKWISQPWTLSVSEGNKREQKNWTSLNKKSQITKHNQRTRVFIKTLQYGSFALPSTLTKYQNWVFILKTTCSLQKHTLVMHSRLVVCIFFYQNALAFFCQMQDQINMGFTRKSMIGNFRLTVYPPWIDFPCFPFMWWNEVSTTFPIFINYFLWNQGETWHPWIF